MTVFLEAGMHVKQFKLYGISWHEGLNMQASEFGNVSVMHDFTQQRRTIRHR